VVLTYTIICNIQKVFTLPERVYCNFKPISLLNSMKRFSYFRSFEFCMLIQWHFICSPINVSFHPICYILTLKPISLLNSMKRFSYFRSFEFSMLIKWHFICSPINVSFHPICYMVHCPLQRQRKKISIKYKEMYVWRTCTRSNSDCKCSVYNTQFKLFLKEKQSR
jgi:hypothetical protein